MLFKEGKCVRVLCVSRQNARIFIIALSGRSHICSQFFAPKRKAVQRVPAKTRIHHKWHSSRHSGRVHSSKVIFLFLLRTSYNTPYPMTSLKFCTLLISIVLAFLCVMVVQATETKLQLRRESMPSESSVRYNRNSLCRKQQRMLFIVRLRCTHSSFDILPFPQQQQQQQHQPQRNLQARVFDLFFPEDVCLVSVENDEYGPCDQSQFPVCDPSTELICYNRRPMHHRFYADIRQPYFFIDYANVFCYPNYWDGCSSCSPGRYCVTESRCILEDANYPCAKWL
jgi:hypothetical protein